MKNNLSIWKKSFAFGKKVIAAEAWKLWEEHVVTSVLQRQLCIFAD